MKKGLSTFGTIGSALIMVILILWVVFYVAPEINAKSKSASDVAKCSVPIYPTIKGTCRDKCTSDEKLKFEGYGCPTKEDKKAIYCCLNTDYEPEDVGGDDYYNFEVFDVGLDYSELSGNCKENSANSYTCTSGNIKVKMNVTNIGNYDLNIFANPKVGETYPKQGTAISIKKGASYSLTVDLDLASGKSYKVYGAAKCDDTLCKEKFGDGGIFRLNDYQYITIAVG